MPRDGSIHDLFQPTARVKVSRGYLLVVAVVLEKLGAAEATILAYGHEDLLPSPWFCFDVGERKFAIWRATGRLYKCDEFGAVGDDPIEVKDLAEDGTRPYSPFVVPEGTCRQCQGDGIDPSSGHDGTKPCRWCDGTGKTLPS